MAALDNNLVSVWRMEGNSNDSKGSNNGTDTSISYSTANGKITQGAGLVSATPSRISIGTDASLNLSVFTIAAWVKTSSLAYQGVLNFRGSNTPYLRVDNDLKVSLVKDAAALIGTSSGAVSSGVHTLIMATYDGSGNYAFYINGSVSGTGTNALSFTFSGTGKIGTDSSNSENFNGAIDEVCLWSDAKNSTDATTLYNSGTGMYWNGSAFVAPVNNTGAFFACL